MARRRPASQERPPSAQRSAPAPSDVQAQLADIHRQLADLRDLVVELMQHQGLERAGARAGGILLSKERRIPLGDAVALIWGAGADREAPTGILKTGPRRA